MLPHHVGPFEIVCKVGTMAYKLKLPPTWRIYLVFHKTLLTLADLHTQLPDHPKAIEVEGQPKYKVKAICTR